MRHNAMQKQKGVSMSGLLMWSVIIFLVAILGMKLTPAYLEYASINKVLKAISSDPSLQTAQPSEIRQSFMKRAQIDNISVISAKEIKIKKGKGKGPKTLSADYSVKIPLVANISLYIDFEADSN
tara:strand:+ start:2531 stop:2905 length:375 start_codon:yes stop_codon:yes gene_type:complete